MKHHALLTRCLRIPKLILHVFRGLALAALFALPALTARADTTLTPTEDTYVESANPSTPHGTATTLQVKTTTGATFNRDAFLKFDLSGLGTIVSAKLRINAWITSGTTPVPVDVGAYGTATSWSEGTLTWDTPPPVLGALINSVAVSGTSTSGSSFEIDVTSYAASEKAAGRNVISLALHYPTQVGPTGTLTTLDSSNSSTTANRPQLVVTSAPPTVTLVAASGVTAVSATLNGTVNPNGLATTAQFEYGATTSYGSTAGVTLSPNNGTSAQTVSANLSGLLPNTTYHYRLTATNSAGTSSTTDGTFATPVAPPPSLTVAAATSVGATSAMLSGTVNPNGYATTAQFEYGPTTSYGSPASVRLSPNDGSSAQTVSAIPRNLQPGITYHYRLMATNPGGTTSTTDGTFTTPGAAPSVTLAAATGVTGSTATLNGTVNPNGLTTTAQFEYGTSTGYGSTASVSLSPNDGTSGQTVSASLSGLTPGVTYHYRLTATNSGGPSSTADGIFTAGAPIVTISAATDLTGTIATLNATVNPNWSPTTAQFEYGPTINLGSTASVTLSPSDGTSAQAVSAAISGLFAGKIYYFRIVATNANGTSTSTTLSLMTSPRGVVAELGGSDIQFSPAPKGSTAGAADRMPVLRQLNAGGVRIAGIFPSMCWNGTTADASICDAVVLMAHAQGVQPQFLINFYEDPAVPLTFGSVGEPDSEVFAIARAFAERFHPNSAWLISQGIYNWGIQVYSAINEPDVGGKPIPLTGTVNYATTVEAFADGVHSVDARLKVVNGAFGSQYQHDYTVGGYGPAIAHLFNNGKLDGMMIHTYNAIAASPIVKADGTVTFGDSSQAYFDSIKSACGITRDIAFYQDEFNFKSAIANVTEELAAKRFLTCMWASFGVVKADGTRASRLSNPWNIFHTQASDPELYFFMCTQLTPTWIPTPKGATLAMTANLMTGMHFVSLYPKGTGVFTLNGNGRKMWVWQNYPNWSTIQGTSFTITDIPSGATQVAVYGWDGVRQTVPLTLGQTSVTITGQPTLETLMFVADASDPDPAMVVQDAAGAMMFSEISTSDFGTSGDGGVTRVFTITNNGTGSLTGLAVSVDGADFVAGAPGSATLAPGASTTFSVTLNPCFGARSGNVHIASNDPNAPRFDIGVTGIGSQANLAPTALDDIASTEESTPVTINVATNDTDPDAGPLPLAALSVTQPAHGTAVVNNGQIVYTPTGGFFGAQDTFNYTVTDGDLTATANVTVTVNAPTTGTVAVTSTADTYAQDGLPTSNFGTSTNLLCKNDGSTNFVRDTYLKFDLSSAGTVVSGKLRLHAMLSTSGTVSIGVYAVADTTWSETALNWNNRPALGAALTTGTVTGTVAQWFEFDVGSYLASEKAAGRNIVSLGLHYATISDKLTTIGSRESSFSPELVLSSLLPTAFTTAVTAVTATTGTLHATVNPGGAATTIFFSLNGSPAGSVSAGNGTSATTVNLPVTGLAPHTLYTVTTTATNSAGSASGNEVGAITFTTLTAQEAWRQTWFGSTLNSGNGADDADPNRNGIQNLLEYGLGGDPVGNTTGLGILPQVGRSVGNTLQISFTRFLDRTELTLTVFAADALTGTWTPLAASTAGGTFVVLAPGATAPESGTGNTRSVTVTDLYPVTDPAHPKRFLKLEVAR